MTNPDAPPTPPTPVYAAAYEAYWDAGWRGVLPLPSRQKKYPPRGWTGNDGAWPSFADLDEWATAQPDANLALRLPETVVGIDVDAYPGKAGAATLANTEALWGRLPATWRTTSRDDGVSGIRLYRAPAGLAWPNDVGPGIETVRHAHRYAVAWPSIHPDTGNTYRWINPHGHPVIGTVPTPPDHPPQPPPRGQGRTRGQAANPQAKANLTGAQTAAWLTRLAAGQPCRAVTRALEQRLTELATPGGSRHDTCVEGTGRLVHLAAEGHRGVPAALAQLRTAFLAAVAGDRTPGEAQSEWDRQLTGAIHLAAATTGNTPWTAPAPSSTASGTAASTAPPMGPVSPSSGNGSTANGTRSAVDPCDDPFAGLIDRAPASPAQALAAAATAAATPTGDTAWTTTNTSSTSSSTPAPSNVPSSASADRAPAPGTSTATTLDAPATAVSDPTPDEPPRPTWEPVNLQPYLDGTHTPETPTLLTRTDGQALIYPGLVHDFHGESESGKSLVAQALAATQVQAGHDVLYVDFESGPHQLVGRLIALGCTPDELADHFTYVRPEVSPYALAEAPAWAGLLQRTFTLAILDGVTDALGQFGGGTKENDDIAAWHRAVPRMLTTRTGAATILIDHVVKNGDTRGRFALGGQAKMAAIDGASYVVEITEPIGKGMRGTVTLRIGKDRPGEIRPACGKWRALDRTQEAARVTVDSTGDTGTILVTFDPPRDHVSDGHDTGKPFKPTGVMERLSRLLEARGEATSQNQLYEAYTGDGGKAKKQTFYDAINLLVDGRHFDETAGPRGARMFRSIAVYRQRTDPDSDSYEAPLTGLIDTTERPSPDLPPTFPRQGGSTFPHHLPPIGEVGKVTVDPAPRPSPTVSPRFFPIDPATGEMFDPRTGEVVDR